MNNILDEASPATIAGLQFGSILLWAAASLIAALVLGHMARMYYQARSDQTRLSIRWLGRALPLIAPLSNMIFLTIGLAIFHAREIDSAHEVFLTHGAGAWFILTLIHVVTQSRAKTAIFAIVLLPYMALSAFGLLGAIEDRLSDMSFTVGKFNLTALHLVRFVVTAVLLVWLTNAMSRGIDYSLTRVHNIHGNTRQLFLTIARTCLYAAAILFALSTLGIDLTAFAVFSGALGVGLGFGLQKIAANFISGLILLTERAINIGDMIEIGEVRGIVRFTAARYTLVEIGDSREVMIPNESFIAQQVINWTLSSTRGLLRIPVPVSYDSDLDRARALILQAASEHRLCLQDPPPGCNLQTFGDIAVNFLLTMWIADIRENRSITQSEVLLDIWRKFRENGIGIPHQIRDTQITSVMGEKTAALSGGGTAAPADAGTLE